MSLDNDSMDLSTFDKRLYISHKSFINFTNITLELLQEQKVQMGIAKEYDEDKINNASAVLTEKLNLLHDIVNTMIEVYQEQIKEGFVKNKYTRHDMLHPELGGSIGIVMRQMNQEVYIDHSDLVRLIESVKISFIKFMKNRDKTSENNEYTRISVEAFKYLKKLFSGLAFTEHQLN